MSQMLSTRRQLPLQLVVKSRRIGCHETTRYSVPAINGLRHDQPIDELKGLITSPVESFGACQTDVPDKRREIVFELTAEHSEIACARSLPYRPLFYDRHILAGSRQGERCREPGKSRPDDCNVTSSRAPPIITICEGRLIPPIGGLFEILEDCIGVFIHGRAVASSSVPLIDLSCDRVGSACE